jgi:hypothetical protein
MRADGKDGSGLRIRHRENIPPAVFCTSRRTCFFFTSGGGKSSALLVRELFPDQCYLLIFIDHLVLLDILMNG